MLATPFIIPEMPGSHVVVCGSAVRIGSSKGQPCLLYSCAPFSRIGKRDHGLGGVPMETQWSRRNHRRCFSARKLSPPRLGFGAAAGIQVWAHALRSKPGLQECPHQLDVNIPGSKVLTLALLGTGFPKACAYRLSFPHWPLSTWALCKLG